ncbi:DNA repair and recombination protein RAD54B isoform X3 [Cryptotermes secundus]|uniref:DNA repair and recombination protein RAD54B isoform X3 n=1 Tax=Cryptotermes secundus TaxID=105785 RepID=UPI001454BF99|nr:DNA repair and recombination protein RAD54B isoform X3 [Cryptotermes secundus]
MACFVMRRSTAPSLRQGAKFVSPSSEREPDHFHLAQISSRATHSAAPFPNAVRSTANILDLLSGSRTASPGDGSLNDDYAGDMISVSSISTACAMSREAKASSVHVLKAENVDRNQIISQRYKGKRLFNVVWGKQSKRKHKTWEGDGILEIGEKAVVLKIIDVADSSDAHDAQSDNCANIGSKRLPDSTANASIPVLKKPRKTSSQPALFSVQKRKGPEKPLIMPPPTHEHQWKYNPAHLPVVDVNVDNCIARVLRPHQRLGIVFMYECILGMRKSENYGAILADEMGLGKTLQCIAVVWMLLKQGPYGGQPVLHRILIVTPSSLVENWQNEFLRWLGQERVQTFVVDQKNRPSDYKHLPQIPIMLISYEMFVRYYDDISQIHFDLLICDEGHRLKNTTIRTYALLYQLDCKRRILLTGTPIQNDLQEFYALVNFTNPGVLGSNTEFRKYFEEPILASRQPSADKDVINLGEQRATELNHCTSWFILRRTQEIIDKYLPTRHEMVVFCHSTPLQQAMYKAAVDYWESRGCESGPEEVAHLGVITALKKICNHPSLVKPRRSQQLPGEEDISYHLVQNYPVQNDAILPQQSGKLDVVMCLLQELNHTKKKVVLVSYYTQTLDMLANMCEQKQYKFCRLDGSTPSTQRMQIVRMFNRQHSDHFVFLLSARAGGVGLNLTGASHLVLYDSDWNPATDLQAMSRIWRDGQIRSVYIYRLLTAGSIEEKIFQRQISKTGLSGAVVDPQNQSKIRLSNEELKDLFTFHHDSACITHEMLDCQCAGVGLIPHENLQLKGKQTVNEYGGDELSSQRDCQLQVAQQAASNLCVRMNQLFRWQHYSQPIKATVLQELGLGAASHNVTFIFRNSTSQSQATQL